VQQTRGGESEDKKKQEEREKKERNAKAPSSGPSPKEREGKISWNREVRAVHVQEGPDGTALMRFSFKHEP
jgi:hypothetical protein